MASERALHSTFWQGRLNLIWDSLRYAPTGLPRNEPSDGCYELFEQSPPDWTEILKYFRGSELQNYFTKILEDNLKALIKPQYVDQIPRAIKGTQTVEEMLDGKLERDNKKEMCELLELNEVLDRQPGQLSGGELQRFAIAIACIQRADV